jgi:hypothetical protein
LVIPEDLKRVGSKSILWRELRVTSSWGVLGKGDGGEEEVEGGGIESAGEVVTRQLTLRKAPAMRATAAQAEECLLRWIYDSE